MSSSKFCSYNPASKVWSGRKYTPMYNPEANLGNLILHNLIQSPQNVLQVSDDSGVSLTNYDIYSRSIKFIDFLSTKCNLKQHDVVGVIASNTENLSSIFFASFSLGIAVNPLAIIMNESDICYMWSKIRPKVIFTDSDIIKTVSSAVDKMKLDVKIVTMTGKVDGFLSVEEVLEMDVLIEVFEYPELPDISSTYALILCSSGTTNSPKGICKSHKQVITQIHPFVEPNLKAKDVYFISTWSYWVTFSWFTITCALYGHKIVITRKISDPELWMDIIERHNVTIAICVPRYGTILLKSPNCRSLPSIRAVFVAGCRFSEKLITDLMPIFPNGTIVCGYGCTESDSISSILMDQQKGASAGFPFKNIQIKIVDENGTALSPNEVGEIYYKTPVPFSAYFGDSENYKLSFDPDGFIKSGDIGYCDFEGRIYILDRIKHMIKGFKMNLAPFELEEEINSIDGVLQSCVLGVFDENLFYDIIYAFVIKDASKTELEEKFIMDFVNERVIEEKRITGEVVFMDKFPTTPSGKILNRELKKIAQDIHHRKGQKM